MALAYTDKSYPDQSAFSFLQHLQASLSTNCPELKNQSQTIMEIHENAKLLILDIHSQYKDPASLGKAV